MFGLRNLVSSVRLSTVLPAEEEPRRQDDGRARILIVGGGFAGVYTAHELERRGVHRRHMIDLMNRENAFVFYPLLAEIVSGAIETEHVLTPIRQIVPDSTLFVGDVSAIDLHDQRVDLKLGLDGRDERICSHHYDYLVLALGGTARTSHIPGLAEHAFSVQRLSHTFALRNHLIDTLEQANVATSDRERSRLLTYVVIGGGTTGVEVVAQIRDVLQEAVKNYRYLDPGDFKVVLVQRGERILPGLPPKLADYASGLLRRRGIDLLLQQRVVSVEEQCVRLTDGTVIPTETVVSSVGVEPNPLLRGLPVPHDRQGRVIVTETLNVEGFPNVWALGDNAVVIDPHSGAAYPQSAQHAIREARVVARNIAARLEGKPQTPIDYRTRGQMVSLGHRSAVAHIWGRSFSGFLAWWLWRTYYLAQVPHWERRLRVTVDWTLDFLFSAPLVQLKVDQPPATTRQSDIRHERDVTRTVERQLRELTLPPTPESLVATHGSD